MHSASNDLNKNNHYQFFGYVVIICYLAIYLSFLYLTNFLPYTFDNNESFSSLLQAKNIFDFGLNKSYGLTDEAIGTLSSAHPYVYTHQGNFPRFYTLLLYSLGLRSIESQIFITTFTIGLLGILFCYHYFAKYISSFFACICSLLLMTDYIMFAQWQVNLWRVWHLFFFFSSFLCCHGLNSKHRKIYVFLAIINFACLFYMELAYAIFVFLSSFAYLFLQKAHLKRTLLNCILISLGAGIGMSIITLQDIAFLGWEVFIRDLTYTFNARNQLSLSENMLREFLTFYTQHKIAFWVNFNTIEGIRHPNLFMHFFYRYCLLPYTPFITISSCLVALSSIISCLTDSRINNYYLLRFSKVTTVFSQIIACLFLCLSLLALTYISYPHILGKIAYLAAITKAAPLISIILTISFFVLYCRSHNVTYATISEPCFSISAVFFIAVFLLSFIFYKLECYTESLGLALNGIITHALGGASWYPLIFAFLLLLMEPGAAYSKKLIQKQNQIFKKLIPFILATAIGCFSAYMLLPGYIRTAYWLRYCSFSVFSHIVLYAWFFYKLASAAYFFLDSRQKTVFSFNFFKLLVSLFLLFIFTYCWLYLQKTYIKQFPANHYQKLINIFKNKYYHHQPFISNNYAAPYAYTSKTWGYLDPAFGHSLLNENGSNFHFKHDATYLWFADASTNKIYNKPVFYVCWLNYNFDELASGGAECGKIFSIIHTARENKGKIANLVELEHDQSGHDKWSIIQLPADIDQIQ